MLLPGLPFPGLVGASVGGGDPNWSNVVFLSSFDGTNGSTSATDDSNSAHTISFSGTAEISTGRQKFGTASLYLPGSGSYISAPDSSDWHFTDQPFTVECWYRPSTDNNSPQFIMGQWLPSGNQRSWGLYFDTFENPTELKLYLSADGSTINIDIVAISGIMIDSGFYALCVDFDGLKYRLYRDGTMIGSSTTVRNLFNSSAAFSIGARADGQSATYGHIDEVRVTKGVARYASDSGYTVATEAFPR